MAKVVSNGTEIKIETSQGTLIAKLCDDEAYPGIWLEIWDDEDDNGQEDVIVSPHELFYRGTYYDNFDEITIGGG